MLRRNIVDRSRDNAPAAPIHTLRHRRNRRGLARSRAQGRTRQFGRHWRRPAADGDAGTPKESFGKTGEPKKSSYFRRTWRVMLTFFLNPVALRSDRKALAAIGQGRLIALWDNLFGQLGQPIAQVLLTRGDISDVRRFWRGKGPMTRVSPSAQGTSMR